MKLPSETYEEKVERIRARITLTDGDVSARKLVTFLIELLEGKENEVQ